MGDMTPRFTYSVVRIMRVIMIATTDGHAEGGRIAEGKGTY